MNERDVTFLQMENVTLLDFFMLCLIGEKYVIGQVGKLHVKEKLIGLAVNKILDSDIARL